LFKTTVDDDTGIVIDSLVFDVSYLAHKYLHALRRFNTAEGTPSGHVYGSFKAVKALASSLRPRNLVFAYDRKCEWRQALVASYKEDRRPKTPDEQSWSPAPDVERLFRSLPGHHLALPDAEADDMAAWYALNAPDQRGVVAIVSADRDLWQLIDDDQKIAVCLVKKPKPKAKSETYWIKADEVVEEFGVPPKSVARIKALLGDSSDSIEGLTGASRPGKKDALRMFATSAEANAYFEPTQNCPPCSTVPDWLATELRAQRPRLLANYAITDLRLASKRYQPELVYSPGDLTNLMGVLAEFECESLLGQAPDLFSLVSDLRKKK
jgi:DNA polymerase-1